MRIAPRAICTLDLAYAGFCPPDFVGFGPYTRRWGTYEQLMQSARFCFCPAGGGPYSFRFQEALYTCVPVITADLLLPYDDMTDPHGRGVSWDDCVVRVPESDLLHLPRILRNISSTEYSRWGLCARTCISKYSMHAP